jgi:hypothetical protein
MIIKKLILLFPIIAFGPFVNLLAQNQITASPVIGLYLYNSENSLPVMDDENYLLNYGFEISYRNKKLFGYIIQFEYSYLYSSKDNVLEFEYYDPAPFPNPNRFFYSDVSLSLNTIDISVNGKLGDIFSYGFGPSFSIVNRSIIVENADIGNEDFIDQLSSFCIGLNSLIEMRIPFSDDVNFWYFYGGLKIRYLHGLFYDEGLRDLDDYNQNFITGNLTIGIGYSF